MLRSLPTGLGGLGIPRFAGLAGDTACLLSREKTYEYLEEYQPTLLRSAEFNWPQIAMGRSKTSGSISETPSMTSPTLRWNPGPHLSMARRYSLPLAKPTSSPVPPRLGRVPLARTTGHAPWLPITYRQGRTTRPCPINPPRHPPPPCLRPGQHPSPSRPEIPCYLAQELPVQGLRRLARRPWGSILWPLLHSLAPRIQDGAPYASFTPSRVS